MPDPVIKPDPPEDPMKKIQESLDNVGKRLDTFDARFEGMTAVQPAVSPVAPVSPGPSVGDQIKDINTELVEIGKQLDEATKNNEPISELMFKRDELVEKRTTLNVSSQFDAKLGAGVSAIDQLSRKAAEGDMPHLKVPEVKKAYDGLMDGLTPEQRMNLGVCKEIYNLVVGQNIDMIVKTEREEVLRAKEEPPPQVPGSTTGRQQPVNDDGKTPLVEDVLSAGALASITSLGLTVDQYYSRKGYGGWDDYYKQNKDYI